MTRCPNDIFQQTFWKPAIPTDRFFCGRVWAQWLSEKTFLENYLSQSARAPGQWTSSGMLTPFVVHLGDALPIILETEVLGY